MMLSRACLVAVVVALCVNAAVGHSPIVNGTTQAPSFSTWQTAVRIPTNLISLSIKRISGCGRPFFWLRYTGKKGDGLDLSAVTTAAAGFANVRLSMAVFGPGLPKTVRKFAFPTPKTAGSLYVQGPKSVGSCAFIKDKDAREGYSVLKGRCGRVSANSDVSYFPIFSSPWKLPATGTYYFVIFTQGQYTAWYSFATGSTGHSHAKLPKGVMPAVAPIGNGPKGLNFYSRTAKSACCVKGVKRCPARRVFA